MKNFLFYFLIVFSSVSFSQNVAINATGAAPVASAMLDITSTTRGLLIPRMSSVDRGFIASPATGLQVYDTTTGTFWWFNGVIWVEQLGTNNGWALAGNTLAGTEKLGSLNAQPVRFFSNNTERMRILATGEVVVGNTIPFAGDVFSSYATGANFANNGYSNGTGAGIFGSCSSTGAGVRAQNTSTGRAMFAVNSSATTGRAIEGQNTSTTSTDIGLGIFHSGNGRAGNFQNALATNLSISLFASNSTTQNNTNAAAIWGQSTGIRGVVGLASLANASSIGINGQYIGGGNIDAIGVFGAANSNATFGYGCVGQANWRALFGNGNFAVTGTKAFQIDHPADPENKFLMHYCIESPEVLNLYRGNVVFDSNGDAYVNMPDYFNAININFSYQLTPIGTSMPNLYVSEEMTNGRFKISGGVSGKKVSWEVFGERNDEWVKQNPTSKVVEMDKRPHEKGKYLTPQLYGKGKESGIFNLEEKMQKNEEPADVKKETITKAGK